MSDRAEQKNISRMWLHQKLTLHGMYGKQDLPVDYFGRKDHFVDANIRSRSDIGDACSSSATR